MHTHTHTHLHAVSFTSDTNNEKKNLIVKLRNFVLRRMDANMFFLSFFSCISLSNTLLKLEDIHSEIGLMKQQHANKCISYAFFIEIFLWHSTPFKRSSAFFSPFIVHSSEIGVLLFSCFEL